MKGDYYGFLRTYFSFNGRILESIEKRQGIACISPDFRNFLPDSSCILCIPHVFKRIFPQR